MKLDRMLSLTNVVEGKQKMVERCELSGCGCGFGDHPRLASMLEERLRNDRGLAKKLSEQYKTDSIPEVAVAVRNDMCKKYAELCPLRTRLAIAQHTQQ